MTELAIELMKRISSNLIRAQQYEQMANNPRELHHLLWAAHGTDRLLLQWNNGKDGIDDHTAMRYAESGIHITERVKELVAARLGP